MEVAGEGKASAASSSAALLGKVVMACFEGEGKEGMEWGGVSGRLGNGVIGWRPQARRRPSSSARRRQGRHPIEACCRMLCGEGQRRKKWGGRLGGFFMWDDERRGLEKTRQSTPQLLASAPARPPARAPVDCPLAL